MIRYTVEEIMEYVEENDVKFIRLAFSDVFGVQKNIAIMPGELRRAFEHGERFDANLVNGYEDPDHSELYLLPDPNTMNILPWRPQEGRVIRFYCSVIKSDGSPYRFDYRRFLQKTVEECKNAGFMARIGLSSEFYIFKTDDEGNPTETPLDQGGYFDIAPLDRCENIRREICLTLEEMGVEPKSSHHEIGPGQNEIDFVGADALTSADNFMTYKNVIGAIAARNGVYASFEPKPIHGKPGNGLHLKISLFHHGESLLKTDPKKHDHFMAGVLNHMRDLTAFLNTQMESYERFGQNEAPKYITWSKQNRSRLLRLYDGESSSNDGFILRSPDSGINPYIAFAVILQAGLAGIREEAELMEPLDKPSTEIDDQERMKLKQLPLSLAEAIALAEGSEFITSLQDYDILHKFLENIQEKENV